MLLCALGVHQGESWRGHNSARDIIKYRYSAVRMTVYCLLAGPRDDP
jgi:hypothetical protein